MRKILKLIKLFIKLNLQKDLIYTFNAFFSFLSASIYLLTFLLSLKYVFNHIPTILGFSYDQLFTLVVLVEAWWYSNMIIARKSFQYITNLINKGTLDFFLTRPVKFRILIPFLQFDFRHVLPLILSIILIFPKLTALSLSAFQVIGALFFFLNGVLIIYSITSIFTTFNFWVGRNTAIFDLIIEMPDLVKLPLEFFPGVLKIVFTVVVPITVILNPTFQILYGQFNPLFLLFAFAMNIILFLLSEFVWRQGLRNYTGAG